MKAIVIISGGLDSALAVKAIQKQGIEVIAIHFIIPFVKYDINNIDDNPAKKIAKQLKCKFKAVVFGNEYLEMFKKPKYGYGKNFNPCVDCKIFMLKQAKNIMVKEKASFVATGEVLGQRPMSQNKQTLKIIARESGLEGLLVRPLSALLLSPTIPQEKDWLKKEFLFDIEGRSRRPQINLAKEWGIKEYPWPGGGCLLTDPEFSKKLEDLIKYDQLTIENIKFLKIGRYFRITPEFRLTVGRNEEENNKLLSLATKEDIIFEPVTLPGPLAVGRGIVDEDIKTISARIIARYTAKGRKVEVKIKKFSDTNEEVVAAESIGEDQLRKLRI